MQEWYTRRPTPLSLTTTGRRPSQIGQILSLAGQNLIAWKLPSQPIALAIRHNKRDYG